MLSLINLFNFFLLCSPNVELDSLDLITIEVEGITQVTGELGVLVFNQAIGFPDDENRAIFSKMIKVTASSMNIKLTGLDYGLYAIALIHDVNSNKHLDLNFIGIPKEPFGFSNNHRVLFGPPDFNEASIQFSPEQSKTSIRLIEI